MADNLKALDAAPLDEEEMARVRRIGKPFCGKEVEYSFIGKRHK